MNVEVEDDPSHQTDEGKCSKLIVLNWVCFLEYNFEKIFRTLEQQNLF